MAMRKILLIIVVLTFLPVSTTSAQFLGQLTPAPTVEQGEVLLGAYLGVYEDAFSVFGQFRYGIARYFDLGLKMGMIELDPGYGESNTGLIVGGDVKYWFMEQQSGDPLDVSVGGGTEYFKISDYSLFSLGGNVIVSHEIKYAEGKSVTPYGRLNVRWERKSFKSSEHWFWDWKKGDRTDSDIAIAMALGAELKISAGLFLVSELEIDDNVGFVGGINYSVF
jgi:hypothetical protein